MKKIALKNITILFCFFLIQTSKAQEMLKEVTLEKQIDNSSLIVEGKVISKRAFWDLEKGIICTSNTVEVYKSFKGEPTQTIEVITEGGTVGLRALNVSTSLKLHDGDLGVFMLNKVSQDSKFKPYGSIQGFYKYELYNDLATNPFNKKEGITSSFYNEIMSYTKSKYRDVLPFDAKSKTLALKNAQNKGALVLGITSFSPTIASAGTKSVLTINGTDFGTVQGEVSFSDANEGGNGNYVDALNSQILSWSDTQITVEIPSDAGTGRIRVRHDDDNVTFSSSDLTILYAESNVVYDADDNTESGGSNGPIEPIAYPVQHVNINGNGGYTWEMQTDFFNDTEHPGARAAFERAFDNWRCNTDINWVISDVATSVDVAAFESEPVQSPNTEDPPVNVVRFDNGNELGAGNLGTCYSWYTGCISGGNIEWYVAELDIVFDDDANWYFGTGFPGLAFDFESVALHELGHGHQLGHVINTDEVMHFSVQLSESNRILSNEDITGATNIQNRSTGSQVCNEPVMTDSTICNLSVEENELNNTISLYPNPAKNEFFIKNESFLDVENALIYDVSGRLIRDIDISNTSSKRVNVFGWSKGVYFVNIRSGNDIISKKLILD